jgi:transcriptional regulator with XRE-family HTH domain
MAPADDLPDPAVLARERLADLLAELEREGLSQQQVALRAGLPPQYISNIKHGHRPMTELVARRLAAEFACKYEWLLGTSELKQDLPGSLGPHVSAVRLPILPHPIEGEPHTSPHWDGGLLELAGVALAQLPLLKQPYVLRFGRNDVRERLCKGDLVLVSQGADERAEIWVVKHRGKLFLARRGAAAWERLAGDAKQPTMLPLTCPVAGFAVGIVWASLTGRS